MNTLASVTFDLPIEYRNLKFYPIKVIDSMQFNVYVQSLLIEKNYLPDPNILKIISMTDLEYIYYSTQQDAKENPWLFYFDRLLALCLQDDKSFEKMEESLSRYGYDEKGKPVFTISGEVFNSVDFLEIKGIICDQNLVTLPDERISKEVRDSLEQAKAYKERQAGNKPGSLEDYLVSLSTVTGWTLEYIYSMSLRKFIKSIRRMDNYIHYTIYMNALMSGMREFKDTSFVKHWLTNIDVDNIYGDVSMDLDAIQDKVSMESAKN
jgi:hypothetical protein